MGKTVRLKSGATLPYDRVVVAPGITFKYGDIEGYDETAAQTMPHAWTGGPQIKLLRQQLENMEDGGVFLLAAPPNPYRCPPAPYERVCLVAAYFRRFKPRAKILVIDAKDSFFGQNLSRMLEPPLSGNHRMAAGAIHRRDQGCRRESAIGHDGRAWCSMPP